jgi:RNA polymerase sigma-70 factor (ECF subfamily)
MNELTYSEEELVLLLRNKDQQAFSYLYDNYSAVLNGTIVRMVDDTGLAEDILQEAFVKIWHNFSSYDPSKGRLFTWMINLTRNLTIDTMRSKGYKKQRLISSDENSVGNLTDNNRAAEKQDSLGLKQQIALLKPELKNLIELAYFQGYTQEEIAQETAIPLGTVKSRLRKAILELRKIVE